MVSGQWDVPSATRQPNCDDSVHTGIPISHIGENLEREDCVLSWKDKTICSRGSKQHKLMRLNKSVQNTENLCTFDSVISRWSLTDVAVHQFLAVSPFSLDFNKKKYWSPISLYLKWTHKHVYWCRENKQNYKFFCRSDRKSWFDRMWAKNNIRKKATRVSCSAWVPPRREKKQDCSCLSRVLCTVSIPPSTLLILLCSSLLVRPLLMCEN